MANYTEVEKDLARAMVADQPELLNNFNGWSQGWIIQTLSDKYTREEIVDALINLKSRGILQREGKDGDYSFRFASSDIFTKAKTI